MRKIAGHWMLVLTVFVLSLGTLGVWASSPSHGYEALWQGANLWAAFTHYAFDGVIWKLRRPETARALGVLPVYVNYRLFMTHLFASIPLACLLASKYRDVLPNHRFAFILPAICTLALPLSLESISRTFGQIEAGFFLRWFLRCFIALSLS